MQFVLKGISHDAGLRVFAFEGIGADRSRTGFSVKADLALARRYNIRIQELPLLCLAFLEKLYEREGGRAFTYSEEDMRAHAGLVSLREQAAQKKKKPSPPPRPGAV
jgi:hypothetical protein